MAFVATRSSPSDKTVGQSQDRVVSAADAERTRKEIKEKIDRGSDPAADAAEAARQGVFGLIDVGQYLANPTGVTCFTPYWQAPEVLTYYRHGDVIDERASAWHRYALGYNRAMVDRPEYPHADLCRVTVKDDEQVRRWRNYFPITIAARPVATPVRTLHEAIRRGSPADVRRLLAVDDVNEMDGLGMTPLAWAVARDNAEAVDLLLEAGANPWVSGARQQDAVFLAAQLGRRFYFERLEPLPGRPFSEWPATHLNAALSGGEAAIIAHMLAQPHAPFRVEALGSPLPSAAALELILKADAKLANALLWKATDYPGDRLDLVKLAIGYGADPNAVGSVGRYGTVLGAFANGISPASVEVVDMLLRAGADPNAISHRGRPLWLAVNTLKLDGKISEVVERAIAIFRRLLEAGADINLPDDQGVPPAWLLLFPYRGDHEKLDASFVTPSLLEMLVQNGLDLNAQWRGRRLLPLVETQAGVDSELAIILRRLGARP